MSEAPSGPDRPSPPRVSSLSETPPSNVRPVDPERGLRGAMSAILVLEAIVILLGIPVAEKTGGGTGPVGVSLICALALAHVLTCTIVRRAFAVPVILALQVLLIACWAINASIGVMGIVFTLVWLALLWMRREFRRRQAAGRLPGMANGPPPPGVDR